MTNRIVLGLLGSCAAVSFAAPALAQDGDDSYFRRDRNVSVQERPRPEYQVPPIQAGAFLYQPRLAIDADSTDNVFATENDEESDVILSIVPSLNMSTAWLRHALSGRASVNHREY
ncbi:MAG: outer membrane beta-barrel protein, partial [Pseudomonadota bacterium]